VQSAAALAGMADREGGGVHRRMVTAGTAADCERPGRTRRDGIAGRATAQGSGAGKALRRPTIVLRRRGEDPA